MGWICMRFQIQQLTVSSPMEPNAMILDKFLGLIIENRESSH
jgi:hypothetical protein